MNSRRCKPLSVMFYLVARFLAHVHFKKQKNVQSATESDKTSLASAYVTSHNLCFFSLRRKILVQYCFELTCANNGMATNEKWVKHVDAKDSINLVYDIVREQETTESLALTSTIPPRNSIDTTWICSCLERSI